MNRHTHPHVVVLGSGFGGLETAFYLRWKVGSRVRITIVSDRERFLFKPNIIYIPFGADPEQFYVDVLEGYRRKGIQYVHAKARAIDPNRQKVIADGQEFEYDYLVIATGAGMKVEEIPGLKEHAYSIWTPEDMLRLRSAYQKLLEELNHGERKRIVFLVPPNNKCSGPLYEIVFMTDTWLRRHGVRDRADMVWTTVERSYIQAFGPRLNEVVELEFEKRRIHGLREHVVREVHSDRVVYQNGTEIEYDLLVSFPPYIAGQPFPGLPSDERGFIQTQLGTRRVSGFENIYAVGDAGDFPVKQAFLAFLQADAAGEHLAAEITGSSPSFSFEPVSMCVMEQFDHATFAQVPLELTGAPDLPVAVPESSYDLYKVGQGRLWRLGKKLLGIYLPWRFRKGEPFHAGIPWKFMDLGLRVMASVLAH